MLQFGRLNAPIGCSRGRHRRFSCVAPDSGGWLECRRRSGLLESFEAATMYVSDLAESEFLQSPRRERGSAARGAENDEPLAAGKRLLVHRTVRIGLE